MNRIALFFLLVLTCAAQTTIKDDLGATTSGQITVTWTSFTTAAGRSVAAGRYDASIANGRLLLQLHPNVGSTPAVNYEVTLVLNGATYTERWQVPTSTTPVTRATCASTSIGTSVATVLLSQILQSGASVGQFPAWSGSAWVPTTAAHSVPMPLSNLAQSGASSGQYPTWSGSAWTPTTPSLALSQLTASSATRGQLPRWTGTAWVPNTLDSVIRLSDYCDVEGVYDESCFVNALAVAPADGAVLMLGSRTYSIGAKITITGKTGLKLYGDGMGSVVSLENGVNDDLLHLSGCTRCEIDNVKLNGNGPNQTGTSYTLRLTNSAFAQIRRSYVTKGRTSGILLEYTSGTDADEIRVIDNYIQENTGSGIILQDVNDCVISNNHIDYNGATGVTITNGFNNVVALNNVLTNTTHGVFVYGGGRNATSRNTVRNNNGHGIVYQATKDSTIDGNVAHINSQSSRGTYSGIVCDQCTQVTITGNISNDVDFDPKDQAYGLQVTASTNLRVVANVLTPNYADAASFSGSTYEARANYGISDTTLSADISGNAATVTNGVYTNGTYADPAWLTSLAYTKLTGTPTFGGATHNSTFEADGTLVMNNDATVWEDIRTSGSMVRSGSSAPSLAVFGPSGSLRVYNFDAGQHDEIEFEIQMPHSWKVGTKIYPHIHWAPVSAAAGNVVWQLDYSWASVGSAFVAPTTMTTDATAAGGTAWVHKLTRFKDGSGNSYIDGAGQTLSSMLVCRLHRDAGAGSDTLAAAVAFLEVDFHYEIDTIGSRGEASK